MTNLAFIAPFPPHKGGIAYYSAQFLQNAPSTLAVRPFGFDKVFPRLLYPGAAAPDPADRLPGVEYPFAGFNPWTWRRASSLPVPPGRGVLLLPWWTAALYPALSSIADRFRRAHPGWRTVLWCHNVREHEPGRWKEGLARRMFARADGFIVHSAAAADEVRVWFPSAPVCEAFLPLHPLPVPLPSRREARRSLGLEEERMVFLFLGVVRPYKGTEVLASSVEAFRGDPRVRWAVAGDFWRGTRGLVPRLEAAGARVFPGYQPWPRVAELLAACDCLVLPYLRASGSGMLMTALAHGVPVLTSDIPHLRRVLPPGLPAPPPDDPATLASLLRGAAADPTRLAEWRDAVLSHAGNFTWEAFFSRTAPFLERIGNT
jgi:glycosyltransferase involved in cell wall biosynthesis